MKEKKLMKNNMWNIKHDHKDLKIVNINNQEIDFIEETVGGIMTISGNGLESQKIKEKHMQENLGQNSFEKEREFFVALIRIW